ncbi:hypothetical protein [Pseudoteredinibacter isoporae]|uniref:hypothetical protein n=1 Tax=Pseudoteredinibacter isoporae TaxID=570281 RepID=UPI003106317C
MKPVYMVPLLMFASSAFAACDVEIEANDAMRFGKAEIAIGASCKEVTASMAAGANKQYLPVCDPRVLISTQLIGGGEETEISFDSSKLQPGGDILFLLLSRSLGNYER